MKIGVIGAGWLGGTVAKLWVKAGHEVMFSSRHPERFDSLIGELGRNASAGTVAQAAAYGDIVLIAVPYRALAGIAKTVGGVLDGKIVIDACNPYPGGDPAELIDEAGTRSVGLMTAERFPDVRLVRGFSSVDATEIEASGTGSRREPLAIPLISDDAAALDVAQQLVRDAGCTPIVVGGLGDGRSFQRGGPAFRLHVGEAELKRRLGI